MIIYAYYTFFPLESNDSSNISDMEIFWMAFWMESVIAERKASLNVSGMEPNIIRTTVSAEVMLSFNKHSRVMPRVP